MARSASSLLFSAVVLHSTVNAAESPVAAFARQENMSSVQISPDGRYLSYITSVSGQRVAVVTDLASKERTPRPVITAPKDSSFDMRWCRWANDSRLLCGFQAAERFMEFVYRTQRLVAANADGSEMKVLMQNARVAGEINQSQIIDWTDEDPRTVLIQARENEFRNARGDVFIMQAERTYPAVFKLDIYSGELEEHTKPHAPIVTFFTDHKGTVRLGSGIDDTSFVYFVRLDGETKWRRLAKVPAYEPTSAFTPLSIIPGTNRAYAIGPEGGRRALFEIDLEDKTPPKLVFNHPLVDVTSGTLDSNGAVLGVFYETDRPFFYYTDKQLASAMAGVNKALPGTFNTIVGGTRDRRTLIIRSTSDVDAGTFYLFKLDTVELRRLGTAYPELDPTQLASKRSIEYPARDGTSIPGYLIVPPGRRTEKLPLIIMPHGGPIARESWNFSFLQQFLASRGYAVLTMNFRGSAGYGGKWFTAAFQDWGGLTYSDITDGARWAVAQGIADPQRMCIVGWSFGGYAALVGATRNSDLYQCSVSIAGLSDLSDLRAYALRARAQIAVKQIGDDREKLKRDSPVRHAKDVAMPVLLIHGDHDAQAPVQQSQDMADALKKANKPHKFVLLPKADHGLWRESERVTLLTEIEQFLAQHLANNNE